MIFFKKKYIECNNLDDIINFAEKSSSYSEYIDFFSKRFPKVIDIYKKYLLTVNVNLFDEQYLFIILKNVIKKWIDDNFSEDCLSKGGNKIKIKSKGKNKVKSKGNIKSKGKGKCIK